MISLIVAEESESEWGFIGAASHFYSACGHFAPAAIHEVGAQTT